jgi:hypothetical protein
MYYTIYKTTNQINGKYYISKHVTNNLNDGYLGSGVILFKALKKYGYVNFLKEILEIYDNELDMNLAERILVVPNKETNYNLKNGGCGGFDHINSSEVQQKRIANGTHHFCDKERQKRITKNRVINGTHNWLGKKGREENQKRINNGSHSFIQLYTCPQCGKEGKGPMMFRWHFDNCKAV